MLVLIQHFMISASFQFKGCRGGHVTRINVDGVEFPLSVDPSNQQKWYLSTGGGITRTNGAWIDLETNASIGPLLTVGQTYLVEIKITS